MSSWVEIYDVRLQIATIRVEFDREIVQLILYQPVSKHNKPAILL